jgi:hypothetical protein
MSDRQSVARLVRRFWAARQREQLKDRRIEQLSAENELLRTGLDRPPAPSPISQAPPMPLPTKRPPMSMDATSAAASGELVMGALKVTAVRVDTCEQHTDDGEPCGGTLNRIAGDNQYARYLCDACKRITTKPTGAKT